MESLYWVVKENIKEQSAVYSERVPTCSPVYGRLGSAKDSAALDISNEDFERTKLET